MANVPAWTLEAWVRTLNAAAQMSAISLRVAANGGGPFLGLDGSGHAFVFAGAGAPSLNRSGAAVIADGTWHHIVGTYDGVTGRLYVDAAEAGSQAAAPGPWITPVALVGADAVPAGSPFDGGIAGVRAYSRALTADEIAVRYAGREIDRTGLVVDLPLDEGVGSRAFDRSDVPIFDGTLTNGATWLQPKSRRGIRTHGRTGGGGVQVDFGSGLVVGTGVAPMTFIGRVHTDPIMTPGHVGRIADAFGASNGWRIYRNGSNLAAERRDVGGGTDTAAFGGIADLTDYHVALVYDGATSTFIVDGVVGLSYASTRQIVPSAVNLAASNNSGNSWAGTLSDAAIFDRALSATEVRAIMLGADPRGFRGCVGYFPLEGDTLNGAPLAASAGWFESFSGPDGPLSARVSPVGGTWIGGGGLGVVSGAAVYNDATANHRQVATDPGFAFGDVEIEIEVRNLTPLIGPMIGYSSGVEYLAVALTSTILTVSQGGYTTVIPTPAHGRTLEVGQIVRLRVSPEGGRFRAWLDDVLLIDVALTAADLAKLAVNRNVGWYVGTHVDGTLGTGNRARSLTVNRTSDSLRAQQGREVSSPRFVVPKARVGALIRGDSGSRSSAAIPLPGWPSTPPYAIEAILATPPQSMSGGERIFLALEDAGGNYRLLLEQNAGGLFVLYAATANTVSVGSLAGPLGAVRHVLAQWDEAGFLRIFVDGVAYAAPVVTGSLLLGAAPRVAKFGYNAADNNHLIGGLIGRVRVHRRAFSEAEAVALYRRSLPISPLQVLADWRFDDFVGALVRDDGPSGFHVAIPDGVTAA